MKVSKKAIELIKLRTKNRLALELACSVSTIDRWIKDNEDNGDLTKTLAVQILSEETELPIDSILEEVPVKQHQA